MSRSITVVVLCFAASLFLFNQCSAPASGPIEECLGTWEPSGLPQEYEGEALFIYINGGADIYYEYGFDKVRVQEYKNDEDKAISLEIYDMTDARGAYGVYSFKRGAEGEVMDLGNEGFFEGYYLNFWKGKTLVTLTGFDYTDETVNGLKEIAKRVDEETLGGGEPPELIRILEGEDHLVDASIKYFLGPLGLYNSYAFFSENVFDFEEAATGSLKDGSRIFVLRYDSEQEQGMRFESAQDAFRDNARYTNFESRDRSFSVLDREKRVLFGTSEGRYVVLLLVSDNRSHAESIARRIIGNLGRAAKRLGPTY